MNLFIDILYEFRFRMIYYSRALGTSAKLVGLAHGPLDDGLAAGRLELDGVVERRLVPSGARDERWSAALTDRSAGDAARA